MQKNTSNREAGRVYDVNEKLVCDWQKNENIYVKCGRQSWPKED